MSATVITPSLLAGGCAPSLPHVPCATAGDAAAVILGGGTAWLLDDDDDLIRDVLDQIGVTSDWADSLLRYARTALI